MNKKQLILIMIIALSIPPIFCFGQDKNKLLKEGTYVPLNKPAFEYGRLTCSQDNLSWLSGIKAKYKIIEETEQYCIIEITSMPLPKFYDEEYRYIQITWVEPEAEQEVIGFEFAKSLKDFNKEGNEWFSYGLINKEEKNESKN